ncbi:MAG: phosphate ABC transporter permease PstA [Fimbriiglobus sp.]
MTETPTDPNELRYSLFRKRTLSNALLNALVTVLTLLALIPLFAVLSMLISRGAAGLNWDAFTSTPPTALQKVGGGFGNALVGTLFMVTVASLISVPTGILGACYLAEISPNSRLAQLTRFFVKLMTGFPSVLAGVFAYGAVVMLLGTFSPWAGGVALAILMVPTVMLTAEEAMRMVPVKMKDAAIGMGATQTQVVRTVILPTALPSILTGVMLAVARACGETAPLLLTALFSNGWIYEQGELNLNDRTASLAVLIFKFSSSPHEHQVNMAWSAALMLVMLVLGLNLLGQLFSRKRTS